MQLHCIAVSVSFGNYTYVYIYFMYKNLHDQTWFDVLHSVDFPESIIREMCQTTSCRNRKCTDEGKRLCATPGGCGRGGGG